MSSSKRRAVARWARSLRSSRSRTSAPVEGPLKPIERRATGRDLAVRKYWEGKELEALIICREANKSLGLPIKIVKAEYSFDGTRLTFLYSSDSEEKDRNQRLAARNQQVVPRARRDEAHRPARRGQADWRLWRVRRGALLLALPHRVQPGLDQDGEGAGHQPEPARDHGHVRAAALLPGVRVRAVRHGPQELCPRATKRSARRTARARSWRFCRSRIRCWCRWASSDSRSTATRLCRWKNGRRCKSGPPSRAPGGENCTCGLHKPKAQERWRKRRYAAQHRAAARTSRSPRAI